MQTCYAEQQIHYSGRVYSKKANWQAMDATFNWELSSEYKKFLEIELGEKVEENN